MPLKIFLAVLLFAVLQAPRLSGQQAATTSPTSQLPKDPRALLALATPHYDLSDPSLKPWHLKATYQLFDDNGNPSDQGTFEYWWASPKVYRSTWSRAGSIHTDWHTADDKHFYVDSGKSISLFEYKLETAILHPLPEGADLDPAKNRLDREELKLSDIKFPCIMIVPIMPQHGRLQVVPLGLFPTYCFNPSVPALQIRDSFGTIAEYLDRIVIMQGRYLPRDIKFFEGKQKVLTANVDIIDGISATDAAFAPAPTAISPKTDKATIAGGIMAGMLLKKQAPIYPQDAKDAHVSGRVVLEATIGRDGKIHDLSVEEAPWPSLVAASLIAVSKWEYKPCILNGEPIEVQTTINVIFDLGG